MQVHSGPGAPLPPDWEPRHTAATQVSGCNQKKYTNQKKNQTRNYIYKYSPHNVPKMLWG